MNEDYSDIIHLPHHVSSRRARMSPGDRAAQFAPFAALTGYDEVIREAQRLVEAPIDLGPDAREELDRKLMWLRQSLPQQVTVTWFCPDSKKTWGGRYERKSGQALRLYRGMLWLCDGTQVPLDAVTDLQGAFPE